MKTGKPLIVLLLAVILGLSLEGMARAESAGDYHERGVYAAEKGQYDQAIADFNKGLELNPRDAEAYNNRGLYFYYKKEYGRAWEDIRKARSLGLEINPQFLDALRRASEREK